MRLIWLTGLDGGRVYLAPSQVVRVWRAGPREVKVVMVNGQATTVTEPVHEVVAALRSPGGRDE